MARPVDDQETYGDVLRMEQDDGPCGDELPAKCSTCLLFPCSGPCVDGTDGYEEFGGTTGFEGEDDSRARLRASNEGDREQVEQEAAIWPWLDEESD